MCVEEGILLQAAKYIPLHRGVYGGLASKKFLGWMKRLGQLNLAAMG